MGRIICIANQKGGVGKTTTAVNLGACLALNEQRTLLVDFDPQANASSGLGLRVREGEPSIYEALLGHTDIRSVLRDTSLPYLSIAPTSQGLYGAEIELISLDKWEHELSGTVRPLSRGFSFILIDCPPSLGVLTINALIAADSVLVPIQCEYYALEGVAKLMETIRRIKTGPNPNLEVEGFLLTMFDARSNLNHQVAQSVRDRFGAKVYQTVIPRNVRLSEAPSHGKPIVLYDTTSRGALSYHALAKEILYGQDGGIRQKARSVGTGP
jgi:chromosome partitioning protein